MTNQLERLEEEICQWPSISTHPHRFGGREFRFQSAEVGHMHTWGVVDIPFPLQFAMRSWRKVSLRSTAGFPTQDGSRSISVTMKDSSTPSGSCGCHTCGTRSRPRVILGGCLSRRVTNYT